jgi:hypothetical protein
MPPPKGKSNNPKGKPVGTKSRQTVAVKQCILNAFEHIGGVKNLVKWAQENETEFYTKMWVKVMPQEITGEDGEDIKITITKMVYNSGDKY